jgi:hypothetical protein
VAAWSSDFVRTVDGHHTADCRGVQRAVRRAGSGAGRSGETAGEDSGETVNDDASKAIATPSGAFGFQVKCDELSMKKRPREERGLSLLRIHCRLVRKEQSKMAFQFKVPSARLIRSASLPLILPLS